MEGETQLPAVELTRARQQQLQWAAFASGVASLLEDSEQAERSRRRQWAAAAARDEHANLLQLLELSAQVELWTSRTQERLLPLAPHVWRTREQVAVAARALWGGDIFVELYGSWAAWLQLPASDVDLVVCGVPREVSPADALRALVPALEAQPWVASLTLLLHGRVPLIKAVTILPAELGDLCSPAGQLSLDISLDVAVHICMCRCTGTHMHT